MLLSKLSKSIPKRTFCKSTNIFKDILDDSSELDKILSENNCNEINFKYMTYSEYINSPFGKYRSNVL